MSIIPPFFSFRRRDLILGGSAEGDTCQLIEWLQWEQLPSRDPRRLRCPGRRWRRRRWLRTSRCSAWGRTEGSRSRSAYSTSDRWRGFVGESEIHRDPHGKMAPLLLPVAAAVGWTLAGCCDLCRGTIGEPGIRKCLVRKHCVWIFFSPLKML